VGDRGRNIRSTRKPVWTWRGSGIAPVGKFNFTGEPPIATAVKWSGKLNRGSSGTCRKAGRACVGPRRLPLSEWHYPLTHKWLMPRCRPRTGRSTCVHHHRHVRTSGSGQLPRWATPEVTSWVPRTTQVFATQILTSLVLAQLPRRCARNRGSSGEDEAQNPRFGEDPVPGRM
jgi:hypothetical protein